MMTTLVAKTGAVSKIAFYRERHRINAVSRQTASGLVLVCTHDGLRLDPRKGGYVHSAADIHRASDEAGYVPVGKCRTCSKTFADHLRMVNPHSFTE